MGKNFELYLLIALFIARAGSFVNSSHEKPLSNELTAASTLGLISTSVETSPRCILDEEPELSFPNKEILLPLKSDKLELSSSKNQISASSRTRVRRKLANCSADTNCNASVGGCPGDSTTAACLVCVDGWYAVPGFDCKECPSTCATCDQYGCLKCPDNNDCCPSHRSNFDTSTLDCNCTDTNCEDCNPFDCTICPTSDDCCGERTLQTVFTLNQCACSNSECFTCAESDECLTCSGSTDCCSPGYTFDDVTQACVCADNCLTCDDVGCKRCYLGDTSCCPSGRIHNGTECVECDSSCDTCDELGCLTCADGNETCCTGARYYLNGSCVGCNNPNCATCTSTECLSCINSSTECCDFPKTVNSNANCCDSDCTDCNELGCTGCQLDAPDCCSDGFYNSGILCTTCDSSCATCDDQGCLSCPTGDTTCCIDGRYYDESTGSCANCPTPNVDCATCDGDGCLTCVSGTDCCPLGKYHDGSQCSACDGECSACENAADECTVCRNTSLDAPGCCPENQNDDDGDGECACTNGGGTISDCECLDGQVYIDSACIAIISLTGPSSASTRCSEESLTFTATSNVSVDTYVWTVDPTNSDLDSTLAAETSDTLTVPINQLSEDTYTFTVTITISGQSYSDNQSVQMTAEGASFVLSPDTNPLEIPDCSAGETINIVLTNPCTSTATYSWVTIPEGISSTESSVTIDPSVLASGSYTLEVLVAANGETLTSMTTISIVETDIEAVIDSVSALQSSGVDLTLNGSNSVGTGLSYLWTCSGDDCSSLPTSVTDSSYTIPSADLNDGMIFTISLTVSASGCSSSDSQFIAIEPCHSSSTAIVDPSQDYNPPVPSGYKTVYYRELYPVEEAKPSGQSWENWKRASCGRKRSTVISSDSISEGQCYIFEIERCNSSGNIVEQIIVFGNQAPVCSTDPVDVSGTGSTRTLTIDGCENLDGNNDTLTYTLVVAGSTVIDSLETNFVNFTFPADGTYEISGEACDSLSVCASFSQTYTYSA